MLHDCTMTQFMFPWSRDKTTLLSSRKTLSARIFQKVSFLTSILCIERNIRPAYNILIAGLEILIDWKVNGKLNSSSKNIKPTKQASCCTKKTELCGILDVGITRKSQTLSQKL